MSSSTPPQLKVGLIGAGIFASRSHAPVLKDHPDIFTCVGVWSRSVQSAQALTTTMFSDTLTTSDAYSGDGGYEALLEKVEAVIIALPLTVQPAFVRGALAKGKHVLSEKPIAATVAEAEELVAFYEQEKKKYHGLCWSVAENYRYESGIRAMAEIVQTDRIGKPFLASLIILNPFPPDNPYLNTPWRKNPEWYGGFFIDSFVHASAMLRAVLGVDASTVCSYTSSQSDSLPSVDTMTAHVHWNGNNGTNAMQGVLSVTFVAQVLRYELTVTGPLGTATLARRVDGQHGWKVTLQTTAETEETDYSFNGILNEFLAFAKACARNQDKEKLKESPSRQLTDVHYNSPDEAVKDLQFVEACLESGKKHGELFEV